MVSGERGVQKIDPFMGANKTAFEVMEKTDKMFVGPVAHAYRDVLPKPVRSGLHNFFFNLTEPVNAINYMLQLHPGNALRTAARFGINSTIGVAGLVDVAQKKPFNLHYRPNGFANTLGYWGIGPGPYFFLPLVGPTTLRDLVGTLVGQAVLPSLWGKPFNNRYYVLGAGIVTSLDYRVLIDDDLEKLRRGGNEYSNYRTAYMRTRYLEIEALHGRGPLAKGEIGLAPFAKPLVPESNAAPAQIMPAPASPASASPTAAPAPAATVEPQPPVFVSVPIIESHPVVQPLPDDYKPHRHH